MSLSSAALALPGLLPRPVQVHRSVVIVAGGGRDLAWPVERIASALLQRSGGRAVHLLLHAGARGADQAVSRAANQHISRATRCSRNRCLSVGSNRCIDQFFDSGDPAYPVSVVHGQLHLWPLRYAPGGRG